MAEPDKVAVIASQKAEIKRLYDMVLDACMVFDHYDLPEHAFHYRRCLERPDLPVAAPTRGTGKETKA